MGLESSYDVSVDYNVLANSINSIKGIKDKCSTLVSALSAVDVSILDTAGLMAESINIVESVMDGPIQTVLSRVSEVEALFNMFQSQEFYVQYLNANGEFDMEKMITDILSSVETQESCFTMVEKYDLVLAMYDVKLREIQEQIDFYERQESLGFLSSVDFLVSKRDTNLSEDSKKQLEQLEAQYSSIYQATSLVNTLRNYAMDAAFYMYGSNEDFAALSSIPTRIARYEAKNITDFNFYDASGNLIEVSDAEAAVYFANIGKNYSFGELGDLSHTYSYLTEEEKKVANYLANTGNVEKLQQYFTFKEDYANMRHGEELAKEVTTKIDSYYVGADTSAEKALAYTRTLSLLAAEGFSDGLSNFADGISNLFTADGVVSAEQYKTSFLVDYLSNKYDDSQWSEIIATGTYEISTSLGNMAPSMALGFLTGCPLFGSASMGLSAVGSSREQGLQSGMNEVQAWIYGSLSGASEMTLEYFVGAIPGLSKLDDVAKLSGFKGFLAKMGSEAMEESTQSLAEPLFNTMVTGQKYEVDMKEVLKSGIYGALTAGITNGGQLVIGKTMHSMKNMDSKFLADLALKYETEDLTDLGVQQQLQNDLTRYEVKSNNAATATSTDSSYEVVDSVKTKNNNRTNTNRTNTRTNTNTNTNTNTSLRVDSKPEVLVSSNTENSSDSSLINNSGITTNNGSLLGSESTTYETLDDTSSMGDKATLEKKSMLSDVATSYGAVANPNNGILTSRGTSSSDIGILSSNNSSNASSNSSYEGNVLNDPTLNATLGMPSSDNTGTTINNTTITTSSENSTGSKKLYSDERIVITDDSSSVYEKIEFGNEREVSQDKLLQESLDYIEIEDGASLNESITTDTERFISRTIGKDILKDFYQQMPNAIDNPKTIQKLIDIYVDTTWGGGRLFYNSLVSAANPGRVSTDINTKAYNMYHAKMFNEWKSAFINNYESGLIDKTTGNNKLFNFLKNQVDVSTMDEIYQIYSDVKKDSDLYEVFTKKRWNALDNEWVHVDSKFTNAETGKRTKAKHRLYLSLDRCDVHEMATYLVDKFNQYNLPFYFKFSELSDVRDDRIVLYADSKQLPSYLEVLREIKNEHPDLVSKFTNPPLLTGNIDGWIGYGSELSRETAKSLPGDIPNSYNMIRSHLIYDSIDRATNKYILDNLTTKGKVSGKTMQQVVTELFVKEKIASLTKDYNNSVEHRKKKDGRFFDENSIISMKGYSLNDINSLEFKKALTNAVYSNLPNLMQSRYDGTSIKDVKFTFNNKTFYVDSFTLRDVVHKFAGSIKNPLYIENIKTEIINNSSKYGSIDPKNICFNAETVRDMKAVNREINGSFEEFNLIVNDLKDGTISVQSREYISKLDGENLIKLYEFSKSSGLSFERFASVISSISDSNLSILNDYLSTTSDISKFRDMLTDSKRSSLTSREKTKQNTALQEKQNNTLNKEVSPIEIVSLMESDLSNSDSISRRTKEFIRDSDIPMISQLLEMTSDNDLLFNEVVNSITKDKLPLVFESSLGTSHLSKFVSCLDVMRVHDIAVNYYNSPDMYSRFILELVKNDFATTGKLSGRIREFMRDAKTDSMVSLVETAIIENVDSNVMSAIVNAIRKGDLTYVEDALNPDIKIKFKQNLSSSLIEILSGQVKENSLVEDSVYDTEDGTRPKIGIQFFATPKTKSGTALDVTTEIIEDGSNVSIDVGDDKVAVSVKSGINGVGPRLFPKMYVNKLSASLASATTGTEVAEILNNSSPRVVELLDNRAIEEAFEKGFTVNHETRMELCDVLVKKGFIQAIDYCSPEVLRGNLKLLDIYSLYQITENTPIEILEYLVTESSSVDTIIGLLKYGSREFFEEHIAFFVKKVSEANYLYGDVKYKDILSKYVIENGILNEKLLSSMFFNKNIDPSLLTTEYLDRMLSYLEGKLTKDSLFLVNGVEKYSDHINERDTARVKFANYIIETYSARLANGQNINSGLFLNAVQLCDPNLLSEPILNKTYELIETFHNKKNKYQLMPVEFIKYAIDLAVNRENLIDIVNNSSVELDINTLEIAIKKRYCVSDAMPDYMRSNFEIINLLVRHADNYYSVREIIDKYSKLTVNDIPDSFYQTILDKGYYLTTDSPEFFRTNFDLIMGSLKNSPRIVDYILCGSDLLSLNKQQQKDILDYLAKTNYIPSVNAPFDMLNTILEPVVDNYLQTQNSSYSEMLHQVAEQLGSSVLYFEGYDGLFREDVLRTFGIDNVCNIYRYCNLINFKLNLSEFSEIKIQKLKQIYDLSISNLKSDSGFDIDYFIKLTYKYKVNTKLFEQILNSSELSSDILTNMVTFVKSSFDIRISNINDLNRYNLLVKKHISNYIKTGNSINMKDAFSRLLFNKSCDEMTAFFEMDADIARIENLISKIEDPKLRDILRGYSTLFEFYKNNVDSENLSVILDNMIQLPYAEFLSYDHDLSKFFRYCYGLEVDQNLTRLNLITDTTSANKRYVGKYKGNIFSDDRPVAVSDVDYIEINSRYRFFQHTLNAYGSGGKIQYLSKQKNGGASYICFSLIGDDKVGVFRNPRDIHHVSILYDRISPSNFIFCSERDLASYAEKNSRVVKAERVYLNDVSDRILGSTGETCIYYNEYTVYRDGLSPAGILVTGDVPCQAEIDAAATLGVPLVKINKVAQTTTTQVNSVNNSTVIQEIEFTERVKNLVGYINGENTYNVSRESAAGTIKAFELDEVLDDIEFLNRLVNGEFLGNSDVDVVNRYHSISNNQSVFEAIVTNKYGSNYSKLLDCFAFEIFDNPENIKLLALYNIDHISHVYWEYLSDIALMRECAAQKGISPLILNFVGENVRSDGVFIANLVSNCSDLTKLGELAEHYGIDLDGVTTIVEDGVSVEQTNPSIDLVFEEMRSSEINSEYISNMNVEVIAKVLEMSVNSNDSLLTKSIIKNISKNNLAVVYRYLLDSSNIRIFNSYLSQSQIKVLAVKFSNNPVLLNKFIASLNSVSASKLFNSLISNHTAENVALSNKILSKLDNSVLQKLISDGSLNEYLDKLTVSEIENSVLNDYAFRIADHGSLEADGKSFVLLTSDQRMLLKDVIFAIKRDYAMNGVLSDSTKTLFKSLDTKTALVFIDKAFNSKKFVNLPQEVISMIDVKEIPWIIYQSTNKSYFSDIVSYLTNDQIKAIIATHVSTPSVLNSLFSNLSSKQLESVVSGLDTSNKYENYILETINNYVNASEICSIRQMIDNNTISEFVDNLSNEELGKKIDLILTQNIKDATDIADILINVDSDRVYEDMVIDGFIKYHEKLPDDLKYEILSELTNSCDNQFMRFSAKDGTYGIDQGEVRRHAYYVVKNNFVDDINNFAEFIAVEKKMSLEKAIDLANELSQKNVVLDADDYEVISNYISLSGKYNPMEAAKILRDNFIRREDHVYKGIVNKLVKMGTDRDVATMILDSIDTTGVCSYASVANMLFNTYMNNPKQFQKEFGFKLYSIVNGKQEINSLELLADMYIYINSDLCGGSLFKITDGKITLTSEKIDTNQQIRLSNSSGIKYDLVNKYLKVKNSSLVFETKSLSSARDINVSKYTAENIRNVIARAMQDGKQVSLGIYQSNKEFRFLENGEVKQSSLKWKEGNGHAVFVTGLTKDGVIVSTWGERRTISFDDFIDNKFTINISSFTENNTNSLAVETNTLDDGIKFFRRAKSFSGVISDSYGINDTDSSIDIVVDGASNKVGFASKFKNLFAASKETLTLMSGGEKVIIEANDSNYAETMYRIQAKVYQYTFDSSTPLSFKTFILNNCTNSELLVEALKSMPQDLLTDSMKANILLKLEYNRYTDFASLPREFVDYALNNTRDVSIITNILRSYPNIDLSETLMSKLLNKYETFGPLPSGLPEKFIGYALKNLTNGFYLQFIVTPSCPSYLLTPDVMMNVWHNIERFGIIPPDSQMHPQLINYILKVSFDNKFLNQLITNLNIADKIKYNAERNVYYVEENYSGSSKKFSDVEISDLVSNIIKSKCMPISSDLIFRNTFNIDDLSVTPKVSANSKLGINDDFSGLFDFALAKKNILGITKDSTIERKLATGDSKAIDKMITSGQLDEYLRSLSVIDINEGPLRRYAYQIANKFDLDARGDSFVLLTTEQRSNISSFMESVNDGLVANIAFTQDSFDIMQSMDSNAIVAVIDKLSSNEKYAETLNQMMKYISRSNLSSVIESIMVRNDSPLIISKLSNKQIIGLLDAYSDNYAILDKFYRRLSFNRLASISRVLSDLSYKGNTKAGYLYDQLIENIDFDLVKEIKFRVNNNSLNEYLTRLSDTEIGNLIEKIIYQKCSDVENITESIFEALGPEKIAQMVYNGTLKFDVNFSKEVQNAMLEMINAQKDGKFRDLNIYGVDQGDVRKHVNFVVKYSWTDDIASLAKFLSVEEGYDLFKAESVALEMTSPNYSMDADCYQMVTKYLEKQYGLRDAMRILRESFVRKTDSRYNDVLNKLMERGTSKDTATKILDCIDTTGVCSYASVANLIVDVYKNTPNKFRRDFGFDLYKEIDGHLEINSTELLADMYIYINSNLAGGSLFTINNGRVSLNTTMIQTDKQFFLSGQFGFRTDLINKYLRSKNDKLSLRVASTYEFSSTMEGSEIDNLKTAIVRAMQEGKQISLGVYRTKNHEFRFLDNHGVVKESTSTWSEGDGHAVYVTGVTNTGVVVSTWGKRRIIPFTDFINNKYRLNFIEFNTNGKTLSNKPMKVYSNPEFVKANGSNSYLVSDRVIDTSSSVSHDVILENFISELGEDVGIENAKVLLGSYLGKGNIYS